MIGYIREENVTRPIEKYIATEKYQDHHASVQFWGIVSPIALFLGITGLWGKAIVAKRICCAPTFPLLV